MRKDLVLPSLQSSFLSCEKDTELILRKLFIESQPHSDILKRLLGKLGACAAQKLPKLLQS